MNKNLLYGYLGISIIGLHLVSANVHSMGLRSFVALPVEKAGTVVRFSVEHAKDTDTTTLVSSAAYGISSKQTLLLGLPYRLSPTGSNRQGDVSVLYRHIIKQHDTQSGTQRLGLLGGAILPTKNDRDAVVQAGFVYTAFKGRNEIDVDALYQLGLNERNDSGRYDLSWQYRLSPTERPDWGVVAEVNSVLEINARWKENNNTIYQLTTGLQWIHQKWVLESGLVKDLNNDKGLRALLSVRFHL